MDLIILLTGALVPLIYLYLIYRFDRYKTCSDTVVLLCLIWGLLPGLFAASLLYYWFFYVIGLAQSTVLSYGAPIYEELLKASFLIFLVLFARLTETIDGAIYGFAVGTGFSMMENLIYLTDLRDLVFALNRASATSLMHATATSFVGITLGWSRYHPMAGRFLWPLLGVGGAMLFHMSFNNIGAQFGGRYILSPGRFLLALGGVALINAIMKKALAEKKRTTEI